MEGTVAAPRAGFLRAERCYWLDWLRFGAAFIVMVGHLRGGHFADYADLYPQYHSPLIATLFAFTRIGPEAVLLFFVLSGFLVGGRSAQRAMEGSFQTLPYAIDRITRIYVPLVPALALTALIGVVQGWHVSFTTFLGNLAGVQGVFCWSFGGNAPLWSLSYEIWFYILCGGVLAMTSRSGPAGRLLSWAAILGSFCIFTKLEAVYLFCWLLGAFGYVVAAPFSRKTGLVVALFLIGAGVSCSQMGSDSASVNVSGFRSFLPSRSVSWLLLSFGFVVLVKIAAHWKPRARPWQILEKAGGMPAAFSYTLYLTHFSLGQLWEYEFPGRSKALDFRSLSTFFLEICFCMVAAWMLYFLFERNTGRIRKWAVNCLRGKGCRT